MVQNECLAITFEAGAVATALDRDACRKRGIETGMPLVDARQVLGAPPESCWRYTWSPGSRHHRMRMACFRESRVAMVFREWN
jgi:hypothetical protein